MGRGIIIAAPASGSGKTTLTLALLRHLRDSGVVVASGKVGPDYIDPAYHAAATGRHCHNLDSWAMSSGTLARLIEDLEADATVVLVEGVMGLFDGAPDGRGSAADLARRTGWPVVLVVDAAGMARSAAALVHGFAHFDPEVGLAGVIFNRVGSASHGELLRKAMRDSSVPVFGCVTRDESLQLPERHLGLVQAREHPALDAFLSSAAAQVAGQVDTEAILSAARNSRTRKGPITDGALAPLGQRIAVARDDAFAFCYPYVLSQWRTAGASVTCFSPLNDEAPATDADAVYLPGGYPELHAERLAGARRFLDGVREAAARGATIYGECGGYMVLGNVLTDADGVAHRMANLLPVETSFQAPRLQLGYRRVTLVDDGPLGPPDTAFRGHEFHFARVTRAEPCAGLFRTSNADGRDLGITGMRQGQVMGSFVHLVDGESG